MSGPYYQGNVIRLKAKFINNLVWPPVPADPTTVTLTIKQPDSSLLTYTYMSGDVIKEDTGEYYFDFTITQSGNHYYYYEGEGAAAAAEETFFQVNASEVLGS